MLKNYPISVSQPDAVPAAAVAFLGLPLCPHVHNHLSVSHSIPLATYTWARLMLVFYYCRNSTMPSESVTRFSSVFKTFPTFAPHNNPEPQPLHFKPHLDSAVPLLIPHEGLHHTVTVILQHTDGPHCFCLLTLF